MTMINEVLDKLAYLKLKSAYTFLKELHINDNITQSELKGLDKVLNKEVEAKEENNKLYNYLILYSASKFRKCCGTGVYNNLSVNYFTLIYLRKAYLMRLAKFTFRIELNKMSDRLFYY